jgi:endonuclease/exonuclease/phosphatase family metal-dependent hydrolase
MSDGGPFQTYVRPRATVVTGDFNYEPDADEHARMVAPFGDGTPALVDAWELVHPGVPHPTTFCLHSKGDPDVGELHCDFIFVSEEMAPRVTRVAVDQATQASDHQPVIVELA